MFYIIVCVIVVLGIVTFCRIPKIRRGVKFFFGCGVRNQSEAEKNSEKEPEAVQSEVSAESRVPLAKRSGVGTDAVVPGKTDFKSVRQEEQVQVFRLKGNALWQWWTQRTGLWTATDEVIANTAAMLSQDQAEELCFRYQCDHRQLYEGVCHMKDWRIRADIPAQVIGRRIEALLKRAGKLS